MLHYGSSSQRRRQRKALWNLLLACVLILLAWILLLMLVAPRLNAQEMALGANMSRLGTIEPLSTSPTPKIEPSPMAIAGPTMPRRGREGW